ncbi:MAG: desulfoferrodoxin [Spirochaetes bacterium]|nr:desulfoferrodoxin [Spirochaetota bacterium]
MGFGQKLKNASVEGKEKHVPAIEVSGTTVKVIVGKEVAHPNTVEHHIAWIKLFGVKKENSQLVEIASAQFGPTYVKPTITAELAGGEYSELIALEYCNLHGVWENSVTL